MTSSKDWWQARQDDLKHLTENKCPIFVYDEESITEILFDLLSIEPLDRLFYTLAANPHPRILEKVFQMGIGFKCFSSVEVAFLHSHFSGIKPHQLLFAPDCRDSIDRDSSGATTILNLTQNFKGWPKLYENRNVLFEFKIGEKDSQAKNLVKRLSNLHASVKGLHLIGMPTDLDGIISLLKDIFASFPGSSVISLDCGMGLFGQTKLNLSTISDMLETLKDSWPQCELWLNPEPLMLAHTGVLLTKTTYTFQKKGSHYAGIDTSVDFLIQESGYGIHHEIINLSRSERKATVITHIIGPEAMAENAPSSCVKKMPPVEQDDILLITNMGAWSQDTNFDPRFRAPSSEFYLSARPMCPVKI